MIFGLRELLLCLRGDRSPERRMGLVSVKPGQRHLRFLQLCCFPSTKNSRKVQIQKVWQISLTSCMFKVERWIFQNSWRRACCTYILGKVVQAQARGQRPFLQTPSESYAKSLISRSIQPFSLHFRSFWRRARQATWVGSLDLPLVTMVAVSSMLLEVGMRLSGWAAESAQTCVWRRRDGETTSCCFRELGMDRSYLR